MVLYLIADVLLKTSTFQKEHKLKSILRNAPGTEITGNGLIQAVYKFQTIMFKIMINKFVLVFRTKVIQVNA